MNGIQNVVYDDFGQMFGLVPGEDAAADENGMPSAAAEAGVLICA